MKRLLSGLALLIAFVLTGGAAFAQLFPQPQPYMYDRGYEAFDTHAGLKRMQFYRYIAGARFPKDWDVHVETYSFDPQGKITQWNRYQNITGEATLQTTYAWMSDDHLQSEYILLAGDHTEIYRNYNWEKDANGALTKANVLDKNKKPIATLLMLPGGQYQYTELSQGADKALISTYDAQKRLLKTQNLGTGLVENYQYDAKGILAKVDITNAAGAKTTISYENRYDEAGHIIFQTETGRGPAKRYYFKYDAKGNMVEKGIQDNQPLELRGYDALGRLTDICFFDPFGYPKEILAITYETY